MAWQRGTKYRTVSGGEEGEGSDAVLRRLHRETAFGTWPFRLLLGIVLVQTVTLLYIGFHQGFLGHHGRGWVSAPLAEASFFLGPLTTRSCRRRQPLKEWSSKTMFGSDI